MSKIKKANKKIMAIILTVLLIISTLPSVLLTVIAESGTHVNVFTAKVSEKGGSIIAGAIIDIKPTDTSIGEFSATTGSDGVAEFEDISNYLTNEASFFEAKYSVSKNGFDSKSDNVTISNVNGNIDIELIKTSKPVINSVDGNPTLWCKSATLKVEATDNDAVTAYKMNDGKWQSSNEFTVSKNGKYKFYAQDEGKNESDMKEIEVTKVDSEAPVISSISIKENSYGAKTSVAIVNALDEGCGISAYKIDNGEWQDSNEFTITDANSHKFYAKDVLDNESAEFSAGNLIDEVAPKIEEVDITYKKGNVEQEVVEGNYIDANEEYTFCVTATDDVSGVSAYKVDDGEWQASNIFTLNGKENYSFYVKDVADNEIKKDLSFKLDNTSPIINSATPETDKPTNQSIKYTIDATDDQSGISAYRIDNGEWQASNVFDIEDSKKHIVYVKDKAIPENISEGFEIQAKNYSIIKPIIDADKSKPENPDVYSNEAILLPIVALAGDTSLLNDAFSFAPVSYAVEDDKIDNDTVWQDENTFSVSDSKAHTYYVKDEAGNISNGYSYSVKYDKKLPNLNKISFSQENDNTFAKTLNFLSFGYFFNKQLVITIDAEDIADSDNALSGISSYSLKFTNNDNFEYEVTQNSSVQNNNIFTISYDTLDNFKGSVYYSVVDNAGNVLSGQVTTVNSNLESSTDFMLENDAPVIEGLDLNSTSQRTDFNVDFNVSDIIKDNNSGINSVKVTIGTDNNFEEVLFEDYSKINEPTYKENYSLSVDTKNKSINGVDVENKWNNGELNIKVEVCDNAGNASSSSTKIYVDRTAPSITSFDIGDKKDVSSVVEMNYGYYFKKDVKVLIYAQDDKIANEYTSGVKSITYYLDDVYDNEDGIDTAITKDVSNSNEKQIEITVPADFKGQIYAYATDEFGNKPIDCDNYIGEKIDINGYVHPNGSIIESEEKHNNEEHISITRKSSDKKDLKNQDLYNKNVPVKIIVTDTYSGIASIFWKAVAPEDTENNFSGKLIVDNEGNITYELDSKYTNWVASKEKNTNLITDLTNTFTIENDSNDIDIIITMSDRAGNTTTQSLSSQNDKFSIDKTKPETTVEYNNANHDGKYFSQNRVATITVKERNFRAKDVVVSGEHPNISSWKSSGKKGTSNYVNTATITYSKDADYIFKIGNKSNYSKKADYVFKIDYTDLAGNVQHYNESDDSEVEALKHDFTIDKTTPVVSVSYNNNSAQNGKYFKNYRTATIKIVEHNFDSSRVVVTGSKSNVNLNWSKSGDEHIASISYNADGNYTFDISFRDKANNVAKSINYGSSVAAKDFVVDTKVPVITVKNLVNGGAYKGDVAPQVSYTDTNKSTGNVTLTFTSYNIKSAQADARIVMDKTVSQSNLIEKIAKNDGIYKLTASVSDKAGNTSQKTVNFTVNRFGSVYEYSDYLSSLIDGNGAYVKSIKDDFVITEYNANKLVSGKLNIDISCDGKPIENPKYSIAPEINKNVSVGQSGWYEYKYTIDKSNFEGNGTYKVLVSSQDKAGNHPENTNYKEKTIAFSVDNEKPELTSVIGLDNSIVNAESLTVKFKAFDALGLKSVKVYVNDECKLTTTKFDDLYNYEDSFEIPEKNFSQNVRLVIEDLAGNVTDTNSKSFKSAYEFVKEVTISTNPFVRLYSNKWLFWGIIGGVVLVIGLAIFFIATKKKRK